VGLGRDVDGLEEAPLLGGDRRDAGQECPRGEPHLVMLHHLQFFQDVLRRERHLLSKGREADERVRLHPLRQTVVHRRDLDLALQDPEAAFDVRKSLVPPHRLTGAPVWNVRDHDLPGSCKFLLQRLLVLQERIHRPKKGLVRDLGPIDVRQVHRLQPAPYTHLRAGIGPSPGSGSTSSVCWPGGRSQPPVRPTARWFGTARGRSLPEGIAGSVASGFLVAMKGWEMAGPTARSAGAGRRFIPRRAVSTTGETRADLQGIASPFSFGVRLAMTEDPATPADHRGGMVRPGARRLRRAPPGFVPCHGGRWRWPGGPVPSPWSTDAWGAVRTG